MTSLLSITFFGLFKLTFLLGSRRGFNKQRVTKHAIRQSLFTIPIALLLSSIAIADINETNHIEALDAISVTDTDTDTDTVIIRIAVASNFKAPLQTLIDLFNHQNGSKQHSSQFRISSGATGTLYNQIVHGAPFDIFLAADDQHPARLVDQSLASQHSPLTYTRGQLALAYPQNDTITRQGKQSCHSRIISLRALKQRLNLSTNSQDETGSISTQQDAESVTATHHRIAIANPKIAPYGLAAAKLLWSLKTLNDYDQTATHTGKSQDFELSKIDTASNEYQLIRGKNILHAQQLLYGGHIDFAFLSYSQRHHESMENYIFCPIDANLYPALTQSVVIIEQPKRSTRATQIANQLVHFLRSTTAQDHLKEIGYLSIRQTPPND